MRRRLGVREVAQSGGSGAASRLEAGQRLQRGAVPRTCVDRKFSGCDADAAADERAVATAQGLWSGGRSTVTRPKAGPLLPSAENSGTNVGCLVSSQGGTPLHVRPQTEDIASAPPAGPAARRRRSLRQ